MVLDEEDPKKVTSMTVFVEGDDNPVKTLGEVHQPDNIESTKTGLLVTEDPGSSRSSLPPRSRRTPPTRRRRGSGTSRSRVRPRWSPRSTSPRTEARPTSTAGRPGTGAHGSRAGSSTPRAFGPGAFLIDVQAHTLWVEKAPGDDNNGDGQPDFTYKREGGQLALIRIPGI